MPSKKQIVDLNKYEPKTNGKNRPLFIELKKLELKMYELMSKNGVPDEEADELKTNFARMRDVINHSEVTKVNNTRPSYKYKLYLTLNGHKKKEVGKWKNEGVAIEKFYEYIEESEAVSFPKMVVSTEAECIPAKYEILLMKCYEPGDIRRYRRDEKGKVYLEPYFDKNWVVLKSEDVKLEQTFWVYGYHALNERFTVRDIIGQILMKGLDKHDTKEFYRINHRVYFEYGSKMDIVITKTVDEGKALYEFLRDMIVKQGVNRIHCIGEIISPVVMEDKKKAIHKFTGWEYVKITAKNNQRK